MKLKIKQIGIKLKRVLLLIMLTFLIFIQRKFFIDTPILNLFETKELQAEIINKVNIHRNRLTTMKMFSYEFFYNKEFYDNDSNREYYQVGDTVIVEFNEYFPFMNRIKNNPWTRMEYLELRNKEKYN